MGRTAAWLAMWTLMTFLSALPIHAADEKESSVEQYFTIDPAALDRHSRMHRIRLDIVDDPSATNQMVRQLEVFRDQALSLLKETAAELERVFKYKSKELVELRVLSPGQYEKIVGSLEWTGAVYYAGQITLVFKPERRMAFKSLRRTIRHEYMHAVIAELSGMRSPAWIEEGLAQMFEGRENPQLGKALRLYLGGAVRSDRPSSRNFSRPPIALQDLVDGFTLLEPHTVLAAYAQSLFAARTLVNRYGFSGMRRYFAALKGGAEFEEAFFQAFRVKQQAFEEQLAGQLENWFDSGRVTLSSIR